MSDHGTRTSGGASFDPATPAVVIEQLTVTDSEVVTEARRWSTGSRGASVPAEEMAGAELRPFVTQALAVGARAIASAGAAQDTYELEKLIAEVGTRTAQSSTQAADATAKAAATAAVGSMPALIRESDGTWRTEGAGSVAVFLGGRPADLSSLPA